MARTIDEIQKQIIAAKNQQPELTALNSTSAVAMWLLWSYVVAVCIWTLESLFDLHRAHVDKTISEMKAHSLRWYRSKALAFQFGQALVFEQDYYDNTGLSGDVIDVRKIIRHAAITENAEGTLRLKVAAEVDGELSPLTRATPDQYSPFASYMALIKDAGVKLIIDSLPPDKLKLAIDIYYDALVLDASGGRLDGSSVKPVEIAVKQYLKNLPFDGEFVIAALTDTLQITAGVVVPQVRSVSVTYGTLPWQYIDARYIPDGGYLRLYDAADLTINYIANA